VRIRDSHLLRGDVKARHDRMVELVTRMMELRGKSGTVTLLDEGVKARRVSFIVRGPRSRMVDSIERAGEDGRLLSPCIGRP
jgi:hypothetical protein